MGYRSGYQGDYRSGYRGGLGGFLTKVGGGLVKRGIGLASRFMPGPIGAAAGIAGMAIGGGAARRGMATISRQTLPVPLPGGGRLNLARLAPGGVPAITPGECPKGYRLNKSNYFLQDGTFIPAGTKCVKYRRRNYANGKALRHGISRVQGFERLVKRSRKSLKALAKI